jgi:hypothetical protein
MAGEASLAPTAGRRGRRPLHKKVSGFADAFLLTITGKKYHFLPNKKAPFIKGGGRL